MPNLNLAEYANCRQAARGADVVYQLACQSGGMGYISTHKAECLLSILANANMARAAAAAGARIFLASSACIYPLRPQQTPDAPDLAEHMAYPADPEEAYGWERLTAEKLYLAMAEDYGLQVRIGRYQSVFGPQGVWRGGREKAPTAISRKVATAKLTGAPSIEVWGDGTAIRTFTYIDDAVDATLAITASGYGQPLNVGTAETFSVEQLVATVEDIAGYRVERDWVPGPVGVPGRRGCDTALTAEKTGWKARVSVREGLERTYAWVQDQVEAELSL